MTRYERIGKRLPFWSATLGIAFELWRHDLHGAACFGAAMLYLGVTLILSELPPGDRS